MSISSDHTIRPLVFFPILAVAVIAVVVGVIQIVPERPPAPEITAEPPPTKSEPKVASTDDPAPPVDEPPSAPQQPPSVSLPPRIAHNETQTVTSDPTDEPASSEREEPPTDFCEVPGWRLGPVSTATSIFGFRTMGDGEPRYAVAAPHNQRYLRITIPFTRTDATTGQMVVAPHDDTPPTVTVSANGEAYLPVGAVRENARPWVPFDTATVSVDFDSHAELTLAYLLPSELSRVVVAIDGYVCGPLPLHDENPLTVHDLVGYWTKSAEMISSVRYENPIADAVATHDGLLLRFEPAGVDTVRATFPGPGIASTPLERSPLATSGSFTLQWGEHACPAWVRTTDDGQRVLLYIGTPEGPAIMFERAG